MDYRSDRGFHLSGGLFFDRLENGRIEIKVVLPPHHGQSSILFRTYTDESGLASVMASMSRRGETGDTFSEAENFLKKGTEG